MSTFDDLIAVKKLPGVLQSLLFESPTWTRLEPVTVTGDPRPGLEAKVHDPLWMLARQWQFGEFIGEDAGTPVSVRVRAESRPVTVWQPGDLQEDGPALPIAPETLLDPLVERAPAGESLGLHQRAEAGAALVERLEDVGADLRSTLVDAHPLDLDPVELEGVPDAQTRVPPVFHVIARTSPDGLEIARALEAEQAPEWFVQGDASVREAASAWLAWFRTSVLPRDDNDAWIRDRFEYRFSIGVGRGDEQTVLTCPMHEGGEISWFSFDHARGASIPFDGDAPVEAHALTMLAAPLRFPGMPADRYWQFEDGQVNLARLEVQRHDLARLCVAEFAMVYSNDWIVVPMTVKGGSFTTIRSVQYTTTFGETFTVRAADDDGRTGRFRLFAISDHEDPDRTLPGLLIPPTAQGVLEGDAVEDVIFLRDEMANMVWAVERTVETRAGTSRSRGDEPRPINAVEDLSPEADTQYILQTEVPDHWIPFVPVSTGIGSIKLRKGTMKDNDQSMGVLLDPTPLDVHDEEVPREGLRVRRLPALARGVDGSYLRWMTRRASVGKGEGSSGLAFDGAYAPEVDRTERRE